MHIAKWLRTLAVAESNNDDTINNNILKQINLYSADARDSTFIGATNEMFLLKQRNVLSLRQPMAGSDSGYASTVDDHREDLQSVRLSQEVSKACKN